MPYIKGTRTGTFRDSNRQTSALYRQCLGAWYFHRPTHYYNDKTNTVHRLTRRTTGTQQENIEGKFPALVPFNGALAADAPALISTDYFGICDAMNTFRAFTMAIWFKCNFGEDGGQYLFKIGGDGTFTNNFGFLNVFASGGKIRFQTGGASAGIEATPANLSDNVWHLLVGTHNDSLVANKRKFYVDGQLNIQDSVAMGFPSSGGITIFEADPVALVPFNDAVVFFAGVWGRELNYQEVKTLFHNPWAMLNYPLLDRLQFMASTRVRDLMPWLQD